MGVEIGREIPFLAGQQVKGARFSAKYASPAFAIGIKHLAVDSDIDFRIGAEIRDFADPGAGWALLLDARHAGRAEEQKRRESKKGQLDVYHGGD